MGTLFEQTPRNYLTIDEKDVEKLLYSFDVITTQNAVELKDVIKLYEAMEYGRRTTSYIQNGDAKDEQLAGFGELIEKFIETLSIAITTFEPTND